MELGNTAKMVRYSSCVIRATRTCIAKCALSTQGLGIPVPLFFCGKEPAPRYTWGLSKAMFGLVGRSGDAFLPRQVVQHGREEARSRVSSRVTPRPRDSLLPENHRAPEVRGGCHVEQQRDRQEEVRP